ncbi:DUF742 domain-containing protein [Streptomyces sp. NPDC098789]|uniref:DUF742 domain-containing protein n=1 Tax=Streptomyces sp. NPDC098789 TaxID=3366098 RepID=UPI0037F62679
MSGAAGSGPYAFPEEFPIGPRPYAVTRGRTRSSFPLGVEVLITALAASGATEYRGHPAPAPLSPEHWAIHRLCAVPLSVAELAALSQVPLGVARILIADLAESGLVHVHANPNTSGGQPDSRLLERVLGGLRGL